MRPPTIAQARTITAMRAATLHGESACVTKVRVFSKDLKIAPSSVRSERQSLENSSTQPREYRRTLVPVKNRHISLSVCGHGIRSCRRVGRRTSLYLSIAFLDEIPAE